MTARLLPIGEVDDRLVAAWRELAAGSLEPNIFAEPEVVLPAARLLPGGPDTALLTVERGGSLELVLPVTRRRTLHHLPVAALTTWVHPHCYLGTPLVAGTDPAAAWGTALDLLIRSRTAPRLGLVSMPADGPVRAALGTALAERGLHPTTVDSTVRAVLRRRDTPTYLDGRMSGAHRKRLRRLRRQLGQELGTDVAVVDRAAAGDLAPALASFLRIEASGWKGRAGTALGCTPEHAEFFRAACTGFHRLGRLALPSLAAGEDDVAMAWLVAAGDTAFHVKIAHEDAYSRFSPGLQLELELMTLFHDDDTLTGIDSGSDGPDTVSARLYPDRRILTTLLVPLDPLRGRAACAMTPPVLGSGRLLKQGVGRVRRSLLSKGDRQT